MSEILESVYREHRQGLFSLAVSVTGSHQIAEDSIQTAFTRLFQRPLPEGDLVAYVYKSVRNAAIDSKRKDSRITQLKDSLINGYRPTTEKAGPEEILMTKERHSILRDAIENLDADDQEAIVLKSFACLLYTSPSPRDATLSRMPSSA